MPINLEGGFFSDTINIFEHSPEIIWSVYKLLGNMNMAKAKYTILVTLINLKRIISPVKRPADTLNAHLHLGKS